MSWALRENIKEEPLLGTLVLEGATSNVIAL